jgi:hypothetical protein
MENLVKPVVNCTLNRADVAAEKLIVSGWSIGGYLVAKSAQRSIEQLH